MPIYFLFKTFGLLDNVIGLIIIYTLMNLPIAVWMSYTYFCEILEAGRIDGANLWEELWYLLRPMALPGLSSTGLILASLPGMKRSGASILPAPELRP